MFLFGDGGPRRRERKRGKRETLSIIKICSWRKQAGFSLFFAFSEDPQFGRGIDRRRCSELVFPVVVKASTDYQLLDASNPMRASHWASEGAELLESQTWQGFRSRRGGCLASLVVFTAWAIFAEPTFQFDLPSRSRCFPCRQFAD